MFGIGMQMGGGCASGTLFTAGGGNARMLVTLLFFIIGSVLATINFDWWVALPSFQPVTLVSLGAPVGIAVSLALFAAIAALTVVIEKRRNGGKLEQAPPSPRRLAALSARALAAGVRCGCSGHPQLRHAGAGRASLGHHVRLCPVGREGSATRRHRPDGMGLLADAG